jgi:transposase-like protein
MAVEETLAYYAFPDEHWRRIRTNNPLERIFVHSVAMMMAGGFSAWLVYRYLGLKFASRSWFNLDTTWAVSLILVGALSLAIILANEH